MSMPSARKFVSRNSNNVLLLVLMATLLTYFGSPSVAKQADEVDKTVQEKDALEKKEPENGESSDQVIDTASLKPEIPKLDKQFSQLHLQDGSIVSGHIKTAAIHVKTEFGMLTIPIERIVRLRPGLGWHPDLLSRFDHMIKALGSSSVSEQQAAKKDLISAGIEIRSYLEKVDTEGNANLEKQLGEIQEHLAELAEEALEENGTAKPAWILGDTVTTAGFEIVGQVQEKGFEVTSKFGVLNIQLGDILKVTREFETKKLALRKSVSVQAMAFFQSKPYSTKIRVNKGDRIAIKADGIVQWTNWNTTSSPDGITNRGQWNGIDSGKLVARVGSDNSRCVQIGSKGDFVAKSSGTLYLGISMRDSYASNTGYSWTGEYKAKITINADDGR